MSRNQPGVSPETAPRPGPNQRRTNPPRPLPGGAKSEEKVGPFQSDTAIAAERARAADLGHTADAPSARVLAGDLQAARRDTLTADTASAHASTDRTAAQLAAESFPHTATDGIRAAAAGRLQPAQSANRAASVRDTRRVRVSP
jgi:hypothetical protein